MTALEQHMRAQQRELIRQARDYNHIALHLRRPIQRAVWHSLAFERLNRAKEIRDGYLNG